MIIEPGWLSYSNAALAEERLTAQQMVMLRAAFFAGAGWTVAHVQSSCASEQLVLATLERFCTELEKFNDNGVPPRLN